MAQQPSFLASGTTPQTTDTKQTLWIKTVGALQNAQTSPDSSNNPKRTDTIRQLRQKAIKAAKTF